MDRQRPQELQERAEGHRGGQGGTGDRCRAADRRWGGGGTEQGGTGTDIRDRGRQGRSGGKKSSGRATVNTAVRIRGRQSGSSSGDGGESEQEEECGDTTKRYVVLTTNRDAQDGTLGGEMEEEEEEEMEVQAAAQGSSQKKRKAMQEWQGREEGSSVSLEEEEEVAAEMGWREAAGQSQKEPLKGVWRKKKWRRDVLHSRPGEAAREERDTSPESGRQREWREERRKELLQKLLTLSGTLQLLEMRAAQPRRGDTRGDDYRRLQREEEQMHQELWDLEAVIARGRRRRLSPRPPACPPGAADTKGQLGRGDIEATLEASDPERGLTPTGVDKNLDQQEDTEAALVAAAATEGWPEMEERQQQQRQ